MKPSRVLVVGNGSIAQRHVNNLSLLEPQVEVATLPSVHRRGVAPRLTGADLTFATTDDALEWFPNAAVIATPASTHAAEGIPLAEAGVHLLVEKPIDTSTERAQDLIETCERSGALLLVGYCLRFSELAATLRRVLLEKSLGQILGARAEVGQHLADWRPGRDYQSTVSADPHLGGGAVWELSHEVDLVTWLLGSASHCASYSLRTGLLDSEVEDLVEILLVHGKGEVSSIHLDLLQRPARRHLRVLGTEGTAEWDLIAGQLVVADADGALVLHAASAADSNQMYLAELDHFMQCVRAGGQPLVTGREALRVLELCNQIKATGPAPGRAP